MAANDSLWDSLDDDDDLILCDIPEVQPTKASSTSATTKRSATFPVSSKKKKWISSSFDDFDDFGLSSQPSSTKPSTRKRPRDASETKAKKATFQRTSSFSKSKKKPVTDETWVEKYTPQTLADLAVHKKKITEVQAWIESSLQPSARGPLCLLTGPAGTGKTATVNALAKEMGLDLQEWSNPISTTSDWSEDFVPSRRDFVPVGGYSNETQSGKFRDFLLRVNRYPSLQLGTNTNNNNKENIKKIILIEEIPNFFSRDKNHFHDIIRQHCHSGVSPVIFILSDNASGESAERSLFPKQLQADLGIANISFNPVAATSMVKVLQKIASGEALQFSSKFKVPDKPTLSALSSASAGDIRGAINALQFVCLKGFSDAHAAVSQSQRADSQSGGHSKSSLKSGKGRSSSTAKKTGKKKETPEDHLASIGGRDTSLFLFRALGKILYCKRSSQAEDPNYMPPPPHLKHHDRDPLLIQPEEVLDKCHLSGEYLTSYLHHNYIGFYQKLDDVVRASEYLSDSDYMTADWVGRPVLGAYAASVAGRGLMHSNSSRGQSTGGGPSGLGFKPLHKPAWYDTMKKMRSSTEDARSLFSSHVYTCPPIELMTQLLPFMGRINKGSDLKVGQGAFLRDVCKFSYSKFMSKTGERLDEKDVGEEEIDEVGRQVKPGSKEGVNEEIDIAVDIEDEDINIDEFDD